MKSYFIKEKDFNLFVKKMIESKKVVGPVAKKKKFVFANLKNAADLRLDFDVTILPPKKEFFPTCQMLIKFDGSKFESGVHSEEKILFGVHFYDIKGIDMTDHLFNENNSDCNYLTNREKTTIVGSNIQNVAPRSFWGTIGKDLKPKGHDAFLTKIQDGYVFQTLTDKGEALIKFGTFGAAADAQVQEADRVNDSVMSQCPEKLQHSSKDIAKKVRGSFKNKELWASAAKDCFSCGSCNIVCPTCYCFDIQDKWNVDQKTGSRARYWDACLTKEFAEISMGEGKSENFREERGARFRHRIMRKAAYQTEKLGSPACVGCGRCSNACTADIADPVNVINRIMEEPV
ncbi:MAG: 4Fe-4S dicluster domain-containing protein [Candidatus Riflebacteria bacterium]|nr:4Fe-4S dicluster domain-containing protein [Candidatus Riflebacteria bacterium]